MLTPFGVGVLMFVWVLGRTFLVISIYPRFSFFSETIAISKTKIIV